MKKKSGILLSVIGLLGLIAITIDVTYAFFSYAKEGTTDNTVTTGTITFLYTEVSGVGKGISLIDSYPISDNQGKNLTGEGKVFDFKVTSTNNMNAAIPYEITARKSKDSTLNEEAVKLYLTKTNGGTEEELLLDNYNKLEQTNIVTSDKYIEKTLYTDEVPAGVGNYEQAYKLRMWIDEETDFSPVEDGDGNITYPYNNKTFTVTVNVYANAKVVTEEDESKLLLSDAIFNKYTTIYENPNLTNSSNNSGNMPGLYKSTLTNSGNPTYYFRGGARNYVDFAGLTWRVVRINEDGTIRLVLQDVIDDQDYIFNPKYDDKKYMYYSESAGATPDTQGAKYYVDNWYNNNIANNIKYSNRVATGEYFCEQAKVAYDSSYATNSGADMLVYNYYTEPNFKCSDDKNGYGLLDASVGLLSYDEVLHAGGYYNVLNTSYYLNNYEFFWTMSPTGYSGTGALQWYVTNTGVIFYKFVSLNNSLRPVINLKADTTVSGLGDSDNHWVVTN